VSNLGGHWNLEGLRVVGLYLNKFPVTGMVEWSRVTYGGEVKHHIALDAPIEVYGVVRDRVILNHDIFLQVWS
jgi:hypothetical protein